MMELKVRRMKRNARDPPLLSLRGMILPVPNYWVADC